MVSHRAARRKRASATDLYKTCKQAGTCPSDVINKVEGTTLADKILQWTSLGIFLGGLGIGTGSGTGGRTGYIPLGGRTNTIVDVSPAKPPVVIEPVGPTDPSIVTLVEDSSVITSGAPAPTFTGTSGFEISTSSTTTPAVLDITPTSSVQISSSSFINPAFTDPSVIEVPQTGEISGNILISTPTSGAHGYEEIPMQTFATEGTGLEPISSTPNPTVRRVAGPRLYSRANQQVRVSNADFLTRPSTFVTYDNPAYDPIDTTLTFDPSSEVPDPDFMDIVRLHRPALTSRRSTVRFSRLGQRATMFTRSGKQIGARVHFYHDISPIPHAEDIELQPLVSSQAATDDIYDIYADITDEAPTSTANTAFTIPKSSFQSLSLTRSASSTFSNVTVPLATAWDVPVNTGPDIVLPNTNIVEPTYSTTPFTTIQSINIEGTNYFLWPIYYFLPRKRKRVPYFFTDGSMAF
ncbi:ORF putative L2 [human papillomavirus 59]|uniref:Minor capsid protein L2 n=1 Tax=Human papillomavirus 59 TaxID=37115 RepID=Q81970_HPV59|nr:L2 [human papillomavirus 59]WAB54314.1 L2 [human papillomavirus 59]CAA54855.1 ORF putative L2 [human papillomavirus 59]CAD1814063.1 L2 [human papillomavirus 59]